MERDQVSQQFGEDERSAVQNGVGRLQQRGRDQHNKVIRESLQQVYWHNRYHFSPRIICNDCEFKSPEN
jgi:hypothetical protein